MSAHRPPWNVAGVDYPLGVNNSCVSSGFKNPTTNPPAGTSYSGTLGLVVSGANVTIDCYDMTNTSVYASGGSGTLTVSNSKLDNSNSVSCPYNTSHSLNMVVKYNVLQGALGTTMDNFIYYACSGNVSSEYNYFHTSSKDFMEFSTYAAGQVALLQFNFGQCLAGSNGSHGRQTAFFRGNEPNNVTRAAAGFPALRRLGPAHGAKAKRQIRPVGAAPITRCSGSPENSRRERRRSSER